MEHLAAFFLILTYSGPFLLLLALCAFIADKLPDKWIHRLERWWRL